MNSALPLLNWMVVVKIQVDQISSGGDEIINLTAIKMRFLSTVCILYKII